LVYWRILLPWVFLLLVIVGYAVYSNRHLLWAMLELEDRPATGETVRLGPPKKEEEPLTNEDTTS
jgi:hypothetical protein